MKEANIRKAIGLDTTLTTSQKYTLIMLLTRLDWDTWTGNVSARDIAKVSTQGDRQVKRHLSGLVKSGWLERLSEKRADTPMINHKADTRLNVELAKSILDGSAQTAPPSPVTHEGGVTNDTGDTCDTSGDNDTSVINDMGDNNDTEGVSYVTQGGCHNRHGGGVNIDTGGVSISTHNNNSYQPYINIKENQIKLPEKEAEMSPPREDYLQPGWVWCERCHQHVPKDEPHLYPMSELPCVEDAHDPEQAKVKEWDLAWGRHEPEVKPEPKAMTLTQRGELFYVDEIYDEMDYKRQVLAVVSQPDTKLIRDALWTRQGDDLYQQLKAEKIAPRSAIDWVMIQAGREVTEPTPPPPPEPSKMWTVTVDQQRKIKEADQAWMNGSTNNGGSDSW